MAFQGQINQAINMAGLVKTAKAATYTKSMQEKYGVGSPLSGEILGDTQFNSVKAKQTAYDTLKDRLEFMRGEAELTDLKERQAKILGLFPTKESREIRQTGLERKQKNIENVRKEIEDISKKEGQ